MNQIFKDLATMVHEQGELIDSIEANVETAQVNVAQGSVELQSARQYQVCRAMQGSVELLSAQKHQTYGSVELLSTRQYQVCRR